MESIRKIYEIGTGYTPIPARISAATEIVVEELTKSFQKLGAPVEIVDIAAAERKPNSLPIREVPVPGVIAGTDVKLGIMHKLKRVLYSVCLAGELKKILKSSDEQVVLHFHNQYNLFFFLKLTPEKLRKKALIAYTNHSGIWGQPWDQIRDTIRKRYFQEAECMRRADLVFVLKEDIFHNVLNHLGVPESRLRLIPNGVNTDVYYPLPENEKRIAKERLGLRGRRVILQVGSVCENKGQLRAAEYLLPLMKKDPTVVYAYAGGIVDGEYQQQIQEFGLKNGIEEQIRYMGMLPPGEALNELYNSAAVTILPSVFEAFGLVTVESCAAGVPVLLQRTGPVRIGQGSVLYDEDTIADVAETLLRDDTETYRHLSREARDNAVSNYGWTKVADSYLDAFACCENRCC